MRNLKALALAALFAATGAAQAALPADVTTAFTTAAADAALVWGAMIVIAVVGVGFKLGIIGLKKAPRMVS